MNTPDLDAPQYCGNCGTKLLPNKRCGIKMPDIRFYRDRIGKRKVDAKAQHYPYPQSPLAPEISSSYQPLHYNYG